MFAYCGNNPVTREDTNGDFWNIAMGAVIGGLISAATQIAGNILQEGCEELSDVFDGVLSAALSGAASGALSATGLGKGAQIIGNAAIGFIGEAINQYSEGTLFSKKGLVEVGVAALAGAAGGFLGGDGIRHETGNYYKAAKSAKGIALKVFGKSYSNAHTPAKLLNQAISMVKAVGYQESIATAKKFINGCVAGQLITRGYEAI